ncbi:Decaprenylphosphoryl-beta-D-ribose oxidase [Pontiella desulfatans]|uniref:Decaprenylphosphoryl-beta-D-ribose oxidase n=1 Tax=Pontiella desulfatans TaxID=2750659 RepID=A0A6C2TZ71_PONDE|nr:FAD-binding oxidoreductase [Pontiella desulfatans]VGO12952.1 Decaprenylphosphoryl-beta-D-ribose oxidase [Pontiella desulfatans]
MRKISDWGNYPVIEADVGGFDTAEQLRKKLERPGEVIAYGNGRSYGDASLQKKILLTRRFNKFISFDDSTGELCCQAGVMLSEILDVFVPRGWFLPVTPGTKLITVGGAIGADVHGKNHHVDGSFGQHILSMDIMRNDGSVVSCSPTENVEFFKVTIGGMGLTGIILNASFRLRRIESAYIREETVRAANLGEIMDCFEASTDWTYSVAWIDCLAKGDSLGRSIMMRGEHASTAELVSPAHKDAPLHLKSGLNLGIPVNFPNFALNPLTMKAFNFAYYNKCRPGTHKHIIDYNAFFYPLDAIGDWNRIYGKRGFTQYQFVIPMEAGREGMHKILERITESGLGSFLAVLKLFGEQESFMSFPMAGYTLALDFPISHKAMELFKELDAMVADYGGRLYLAKDSRMDAALFEKTYPNAAEFKQAIAMLNEGETKFASLQSKRIGITG